MVLLKYGISVALFVSAALAQGITIVLPAAGSTVTPGSSITVQVGTNVSAVSMSWLHSHLQAAISYRSSLRTWKG
jgi:hypothetical protein